MITPLPPKDRNVKSKIDAESSEDNSEPEECIDEELCAKFNKIKGQKK